MFIYRALVLAGLDECLEYSRLEKDKEILKDVKQAVLDGLDETMEYDLLKQEADSFITKNPEYK